MIYLSMLFCSLAFYLLGVLTGPAVRRRLDGSGASAVPSTQTPLRKLDTEGVTQQVVEAAPFTLDTVNRVADGLRERYVAAGVPVPKDTELRDQAARALAGYDI